MKNLFALSLVAFFATGVFAQCPTGEVETYIEVTTDQYGYEAYWQLVPGTNACGAGTIFAGGNSAQVGCNGAGGRDASFGNGYGDTTTITEGPFCLTEGANYSIRSVDDYGDGGTGFEISIAGYATNYFTELSGSSLFTFAADKPTLIDAGITDIPTLGTVLFSGITIATRVKSLGQSPISSLILSYSVDGSVIATQTFNGLNVQYGATLAISFADKWTPIDTGTYSLVVDLISVNGAADDDNTNNTISKTIKVVTGSPNIVDNYIYNVDSNVTETIVGTADGVNVPRDLDFYPDSARFELWVINKGTESVGGRTIIVHDAGKNTQTSQDLRDAGSKHFLALPTAIAFGNNSNFATSPGVQDANYNISGTGTFTGPTLWSSDLSIYAVSNPIGLGSHLDMLHGSPFSMGIAHHDENAYWVFDSYNEELVYYDFATDHGPGYDDHSDGIVRRYTEIELTRNSNQIPSHMVLDKSNGWLYIADNANARVLRVNTNTGTVKGPLALKNEPLAEHSEMENVSWEVYINSGLTSPSGIEVIGDRLLVGDYATGKIHIYNIAGATAAYIGEVSTGASELMGIKVGPQGFIWYVDAGNNEVNKISTYISAQPSVGILPVVGIEDKIQVYPQPAQNQLVINTSLANNNYTALRIYSMVGEAIYVDAIKTKTHTIDVSDIPAGIYVLELNGANGSFRKTIQVLR